MQEIETLIFSGQIGAENAIPSSLCETLTTSEKEFVLEKAVQIRGNPKRLLSLLETLSADPPLEERAVAIWHERVFLKGFALARLSRMNEASSWFDILPSRFEPRVQIERALYRANQGDIPGSETLFRAVWQNENADLDAYSMCTMLGGYCMLLIQKGDFREARRCIEQRKKILKKIKSPVLEFGTGLYEILLNLEENDFERAAELLAVAQTGQDRKSVNWFFLLHLQLRLHLARNLLVQAGTTLSELIALTDLLQLPEGVLDFRLEEIEWQLRSEKFAQALEDIAAVTADAELRSDEFLLFRLCISKAQVLAKRGESEQALTEIQKAIVLGESKGYRPALTWAFFHAAGVAWTAKQSVMAKLFLQRGRRLASELGLRGREACFAYMSEVIENRHASASVIVGLAKYQEIGPELEYFLDTYRLLEGASFSVADGKKHSTVVEPKLRRLFFKEPAVFCFQREALLVANLGQGKVCSVEFEEGTPLLPVFRLFLDSFHSSPGVSLAAIHESRSHHKFREDLHAPATKMLLSRLRDKLKPCQLGVQFNRTSGLYSLQSDRPILTIKSITTPTPANPAIGREAELLERIAMEPFVPTHHLCEEFSVSRQALHPTLKKLVALGKIRVVRKGPVSGYIFSGKR